LNDGAWHQVVSVLPAGGDSLQDVQFFVDGARVNATASTDQPIATAASGRLYLGRFANGDEQNLVGALDDLAIWSRGLSATEIRALFELVTEVPLGYDAVDVDALFLGFREQSDVLLGSTSWEYMSSGIVGTEGDVFTLDDSYAINLGDQAGFVAHVLVEPVPEAAIHVAGLTGLVLMPLRTRQGRAARRRRAGS
jgi:hypothetical protein